MGYPQPTGVEWDTGKPRHFQGVTIRRRLDDGNEYAWYIPYNGVVTQQQAADILGVSVVTVNNWVNDGTLPTIKHTGVPTLTTLWEIKRFKKVRDKHGRLLRNALG